MVVASETDAFSGLRQALTPHSAEELTAHGHYQYRLNARVSGIGERWTMHRQPDDVLITRAVRHSTLDESTLELAYVQSHGKPTEIVACYRLGADSDRREYWARYRFGESLMHLNQWMPGQPPVSQIRSIPSGLIVAPGLRVFTGNQLAEISRRRGEQPVMTLEATAITLPSRMLGPRIEQRRARLLGTGSALGCYTFTVGGGDEGSFFWLDENDLCVRSVWNAGEDNRWEVVLSELQFQ